MLIERLPEGRVIAVDGSSSMIEQVRSVLRPEDEAFVADLLALELAEPVDVVFSSAVFHWVLDHDALFRSLRAALKPGGRLAAQNGGEGNISRLKRQRRGGRLAGALRRALRGLRRALELRRPGGDRGAPGAGRLRAGPLLAAALGHRAARAGRVPADRLPRPLPRPAPRASCSEPYVADVIALEDDPLVLDYVRLNIEATAS